MINEQINQIHTPCKNCVFAKYDDKTQINCELHYIDKYKAKNITILEAYDNEKEFFIINGKKCIGYRENKWFKQFDLENAAIQAKVDKYHATNHLDYILVIDLKTLKINQLDDTLKQISELNIQPKKVIIIRHIDNEKTFAYSALEQLFNKYNVSYTWRIQTILDTSLTHQQIIHNIINLNAKNRFIIIVSDYNTDIQKMVISTNRIVHEDLEQFEVLSNDNGTCLCFSTLVYRFDAFHGNNLLEHQTNYQKI